MQEASETLRAALTERGLHVKRKNAVVAVVTGAALVTAAYVGYGLSFSLPLLLAGLLAGLLYANAFEYVLHRYVLHIGETFLVRQHACHHDTVGTPDEPRYVNFATSGGVVILVFALNTPPVLLIEHLSGMGLAPGMFAGFAIYYILYEEIHWRIHMGGWLPGWLRLARRHHMLHHGDFKGRYNVFLPIFDWLLERREWKQHSSVQLPLHKG
jgi:hypothetical protein